MLRIYRMNIRYLVLFLMILCGPAAAQDSLSAYGEELLIHENKSVPKQNLEMIPSNLSEMKISRNWMRNFELPVRKDAGVIKFKMKKDSFIDSDLFIITVGSAVALGAAAAYFKLESDAAYEKYLTTSQRKYRDRTDRYDIYSGIALGVLELNVGFLIYKFLTD